MSIHLSINMLLYWCLLPFSFAALTNVPEMSDNEEPVIIKDEPYDYYGEMALK